jgi:glutamate racemase
VIGVFDSGSGGVTILKALRAQLPDQDFLYFGDHGNAPYGHRSNQQIVDFTKAGVEYLMSRGCRLVILACNTAAAIALREIQQNWLPQTYPQNRVLGVLVPMVEAITGIPWSQNSGSPQQADKPSPKKILLLATQKTINSNAYVEEIAKRAPHTTIIQKACPGLVDAIEGGAGTAPLSGLIQGFISEVDISDVSDVVLGCTHFPLAQQIFATCLPASINILGQPVIVATALSRYLDQHPEFKSTGTGKLQLTTSGNPEVAQAVSDRFTNFRVLFEKI